MTFAPTFQRPFSATFDRRAAAAASAVPWYLAGGAPTPIAVYQPKGAASLAASYVNLVNPGTYDAAPGVAPVLDASGWVFNGTSTTGNWLDTGIVMPNNQNRACLIRFSDALSGVRFLVDNYSANTDRFEIASTGTSVEYGNGSYQQRAPNPTSGVLGFANTRCYRNGVDEGGADIESYSGVNANTVRIAYSYFGINSYRFGGKIQAIAIWDTSTNHATWMPAVMAACAII